MPDNTRVDVDTSKLERFAKNLSSGLERQAKATSRAQAERVAGDIRVGVPVLTGRLRASVQVTVEDKGAGVSYGSGVPYAGKIERRNHTCRTAIEGSDAMFQTACEQMAQTEVQRST